MVYVLQQLLTEAAERQPQRPAVSSDRCTLTYQQLDRLSNKLARLLLRLGVGSGDRVGILAPKSAAAVIGVYGALKAGACYVPLDPKAPAERLSHIVRDSGAVVILANETTMAQAAALASAVPQQVSVLELRAPGWAAVAAESAEPLAGERAIETDLAYVLYTSGSTGTPKGVMISHRNSLTFVEWAAAAAGLREQDRVCSPAPLHFDLSVFDVFATCRAAACMTVLPEGAATFPQSIARWLAAERVSVWYSVPSVLVLLARYGSLQQFDLAGLRMVIFAGEVFPPRHLARLMAELPHARYLNWYGPTETNVCTAFEVPAGWADAAGPIPIGKACANTEVFAVTSEGRRAAQPGEMGELYVRGPSLMRGYWGQSARTAEALVRNPLRAEYDEPVYRTGDLVTLEPGGNYAYLGRLDSMVKIRGYRVELGEVEATLHRHPAISEAVVLPVPDELLGTRLLAVVTPDGGCDLACENVLDHCRQWLPSYMVPDIVEFRDGLPRTSTGKVDRAGLAEERHKLQTAGDGQHIEQWQTSSKGARESGDGHQRLHQPGARPGRGAVAAGERDTTTRQRHS
jgi:amino acid adenylation domain-containing protein